MKFLYTIILCFIVLSVVDAKDENDWLTFQGYESFKYPLSNELPRWQTTLNFWDDILRALNDCQKDLPKCNDSKLKSILNKVSVISRYESLEQLRQLNYYVNGDLTYEMSPHWQEPLSFLDGNVKTGPATALKYFLLRYIGIPINDIRIVETTNSLTGGDDCFLTVYLDGEVYILNEHFDAVLEQRKLIRLFVPKYGMNEKERWVYVPSYQNDGKPVE